MVIFGSITPVHLFKEGLGDKDGTKQLRDPHWRQLIHYYTALDEGLKGV
jgi:hypothetical protein